MNISIAGIAIENGKLFIAKRIAGGDMGEKWEFPGGKTEQGESCEQALKREFLEELGVAINVVTLLGKTSFVHENVRRALYAYQIYFINYNFKLTEHSEWKWATPAEIRRLDFAPSDISLLPFIEPVVTP